MCSIRSVAKLSTTYLTQQIICLFPAGHLPNTLWSPMCFLVPSHFSLYNLFRRPRFRKRIMPVALLAPSDAKGVGWRARRLISSKAHRICGHPDLYSATCEQGGIHSRVLPMIREAENICPTHVRPVSRALRMTPLPQIPNRDWVTEASRAIR